MTTRDNPATTFLWLHLTDRCQLTCRHCATSSSPGGTHGSMMAADWIRVLDQAAQWGIRSVQFVGGEPTLHPALPQLINHALSLTLATEIFTNLVHVTDELWTAFTQPGVSLATSYYSDDPAEHAAITGRPSYARTQANVRKALNLGITLRAGVIDLGDGQRTAQATAELVDLGVASVGYDKVRQLGRGSRDQTEPATQLCGRCGDGVAAIDPHGNVRPCLFAQWVCLGNVHDSTLGQTLGGMPAARSALIQRGMPVAAGPCRPTSDGTDCYPHNDRLAVVGAAECSPVSDGTNCYPHNCHPR